MFCKHCGTEIPDQSLFCPSCGGKTSAGEQQKQQQQQAAPQRAPQQPYAPQQAHAPKPRAPKKPFGEVLKGIWNGKWRKAIIGGGVGLAALIVLLAVMAGHKTTIDLNKIVKVDYYGYDGYGTASAYIDSAEFTKLYGKKIKYNKSAGTNQVAYLGNPADAFMDMVVYGSARSFDKDENLRNGDKITLTWNVNEREVERYFKCKVKADPKEYEVSGLQELGTFDLFAGLDVTFEGVSPNGYVDLEYNGPEDISSYEFAVDKGEGLSNGDTVTVSFDESMVSYYAETIGKIPETTSKEYTVNGLDEMLTSFADLPQDFVASLKTESEDTVLAYTANSFAEESSLSDLKYAGYVLLSEKESGYSYLYLIYSGLVSHAKNAFNAAKIYFPVRFDGLMKEGSNYSYEDKEGIIGHSDLDGGWYSTSGYRNPLTCYQEIAEAYRDDYNVESGDGFELYAGFDGTIANLADITEDYKKTLQGDAKDRIESYVAEKYAEEESLSELTFKGEYLMKSKSGSGNIYVVVLSATASNTKPDDKGGYPPTTVYFPVEYDDVVRLPNDEYFVTKTAGIQGRSSFPDSYYSTNGYIDGKKMFSDIITANRENYTYEVSDGLKEFGE